MAILTSSGMEKILRRIMESGELTDEMESDISRLRDDFTEREGIMGAYGDVYVGEDVDEYEFTARESEANLETRELDDWRGKYEEMRGRYIDRFFGGQEKEVEDIMQETENDVKRDGMPQTFDELLERTEG